MKTSRRQTTSPTEHPEKLKELQYLFYGEARKYDVLPIDNKKVKRMDIRNPAQA